MADSTYTRGACIYCGGVTRGIFCAGHRDLPAVDPSLGLPAALLKRQPRETGI